MKILFFVFSTNLSDLTFWLSYYYNNIKKRAILAFIVAYKMEISKDLTICMFFYVDYNEENAKKYEKLINSFGDVEICYNIDPKQPVLVTLSRIHKSPHLCHLYSVNASNLLNNQLLS